MKIYLNWILSEVQHKFVKNTRTYYACKVQLNLDEHNTTKTRSFQTLDK